MAQGGFNGFVNILEEEIGLTLPEVNDISCAMNCVEKGARRAERLHEYSWRRDETHFARNFLPERIPLDLNRILVHQKLEALTPGWSRVDCDFSMRCSPVGCGWVLQAVETLTSKSTSSFPSSQPPFSRSPTVRVAYHKLCLNAR